MAGEGKKSRTLQRKPGNAASAVISSDDFVSWIQRLKMDNWLDYGIFPGEISSLPPARQAVLKAHFNRLNPKAEWAQPRK
jgi:hypothetical protein